MKTTIFNRLRGFVRIELRGEHLEKLFNTLAAERYAVWDIRRVGDERAELFIAVRDFFRLRPHLRKTSSRLRLKGRFGLPFLLDRLGKRKMFLAGFAVFFLSLYMLSMLVWRIDVEGYERITRSEVLQAAREQGIYRYQWKFRLPDTETLARQLQSRLPGSAWIGVSIEGTRIAIQIVETTRPEDRLLLDPRHLIASKNAMVTEILAQKGKPLVKPNTNVSAGDILISGYIGDDSNRQTVVAEGTVRGIVWEEATVEIPLVQRRKVYTGETQSRSYLVIGKRGLQLSGYGETPFSEFETVSQRSALRWREWTLPVGWLSEKLLESRIEERKLEPDEAKAISLEQARSEVVAAAGPDAIWRSEKIVLHEKSDNGKVYMKVLFEIEQPIAVEQPIVP